MNTRVCLALTVILLFALFAQPATAADIALLPINLQGDPPGPFSEVYDVLLWEAIYYRLTTHLYVNIIGYRAAERAVQNADMAPEDVTSKIPFVKVHRELEDHITASIAVHITVKAPKPPRKKTDKPKPYIYNLNVLLFNKEIGCVIKVLNTTIKPKKVASITGLAALIEKKIVEAGKLDPKFKEKPKVAENDKTFSEFYVGHADSADDMSQKQRCLRKALHLTPDNRQLWMKYIDMLVKAKNVDSVLAVFLEAESCFPDDADLLAYHADIAFRFGKKGEAEDALKKALEIDPENIRALMTMANTLYDDGKYKEAKEIYAKLAKLVPLDEMRKQMEQYVQECDKKISEAEEKKEEQEPSEEK
ncbi:MAG: tetratricopeptide repeat protein [Planctomycetota bacterium]|jgi:hypothetical protein